VYEFVSEKPGVEFSGVAESFGEFRNMNVMVFV